MINAFPSEYSRCATVFQEAAKPDALYAAVQDSIGRLMGHQLFTLLIAVEGGAEVERIWTSNPEAYPLTGRKAMGPTPWGDLVLKGRKPWLGNDAEAIRWAFPDHALIASLGLASCINIPVVAFGQTLGTMNILDRAGAYQASDVELAGLFGPLLALPFEMARRGTAPGA